MLEFRDFLALHEWHAERMAKIDEARRAVAERRTALGEGRVAG